MRRSRRFETDNFEIDLLAAVYELLRKWWLILLSGVIVASVAFVYSSYFAEKKYESTTSVFILANKQYTSSPTQEEFAIGGMLIGDYEELIKSQTVMERVINEMNLKMSPEALGSAISVWSREETRVLFIRATVDDPYLARDIANKVREIASEQIVKVMRIDAVNVIDEADLNLNPIEPDVAGNVKTGAVIGCILACGVIVIAFILNDKIMTPDDVDSYLNMSVLGVIPYDSDDDNQTKSSRKFKIFNKAKR